MNGQKERKLFLSSYNIDFFVPFLYSCICFLLYGCANKLQKILNHLKEAVLPFSLKCINVCVCVFKYKT